MFLLKNKIARKVCLIAVCAILGVAAGWGIRAFNSADVASADTCEAVIEGEWNKTYSVGDTLILPEAVIKYQNVEYTPDNKYLQYPDGSVSESDVYTLDKLGTYSILYLANVDSKQLKATIEFTVLSEAYTAENATYEYRNKLNMNEKTTTSGLGISVSSGGKFCFNVPINVKDFSKDDPIAIVYPYNRTKLMGNNGSVTEARKVIVTLTDCYDPGTYVDIILSWDVSNLVTGNRQPYFRAGASNQTIIGLKKATPLSNVRSVWLNGEHYRAFDYDQFGASSSDWNTQNADNFGYALFYDDNTKEIYVQDAAGKYFVNDLDETAIYDNNIFDGFTTGDVYISVSGEDYYVPKMNVEIEKLGSYEKSDFATLKAVEDTEKPFIVIDADTNEKIYIAKGDEFKIFDADYRDFNKSKEIRAYVYYDYGMTSQTQVPLKDGKFTPRKNGLYTIEYVAEDAYGNPSVATVNLHCVDGYEGKTVALRTNRLASLKGGYECILPEYELEGMNSGEYIRIYAEHNGSVVDIDKDSRAFFAEQIGEYEIVYEYGDKYHDYKYSYKVTSTPSDAIIFNHPVLPLYFIKNAPYTLDGGTVCLYSGDSVVEETVTDVYLKQDDGEFIKVTDIESVTVTATEKVQFRYNWGQASSLSAEIPVVDVGITEKIHIEKYFAGDFEQAPNPAYVGYYSKKAQGDNALQFINAIGLSNFALKFKVPQESDKFTKLTITLCDYYERANKVEIAYGKTATGIYFNVNGGAQQIAEKAYAGETWTISYNEKRAAFEMASNIVIPWQNTFSSDRILLQITLNGINGESGIEIMQINNQIFNGNVASDNIRPVIKTDVQGEYKLGSIITIAPATATDVLSPFCAKKFTFSVVSPSGATVTSVDGVALDNNCSKTRIYEFKVAEYGIYYVSYNYTDFAGKSMRIDIPLQIIEDIPPTITIEGNLNETTVCKVAYISTVKIAGFSVKDNETASEDLKTYVMICTPKNEWRTLSETGEFVAERKGMYKVYYYCIDSAGNIALRYYNVEVI